jgi:hypothetical protein
LSAADLDRLRRIIRSLECPTSPANPALAIVLEIAVDCMADPGILRIISSISPTNRSNGPTKGVHGPSSQPNEQPTEAQKEEADDDSKQSRPRDVRARVVGLLDAATTEAQVTTGTITGTVRDPQGAAVPSATVTITETNKGTSSTHTTAADGSFVAPFLIPGSYEVSHRAHGLPQVRAPRRRAAGQPARARRRDARAGRDDEATEVVGLAPLTRTDSAEMGEVIEERAVRELPLNGRNFAQLVYLTPGVTAGQVGENLSGASTFNPRGASNFNALGSQANTNAWLIDGIDNNEYTFNTIIVMPSVESVREFKVLTGTFSAEFGRGAGVVSVSTKSGPERVARDGLRVPAQREVRRQELLRAADGAQGPARPPPVRRVAVGADHQEQDLLLLRLLRDQGRARPGVREHGADRRHEARRLQRLPRQERQPDPDLRPAHDGSQPERRGLRAGAPSPATSSRRTASTRSG